MQPPNALWAQPDHCGHPLEADWLATTRFVDAMNVVLIADVGGLERHTGDEAMFQVAVDELTSRGATQFTLVGTNTVPGISFDNIEVVGPIGFDAAVGSAHDAAREARLEHVLAAGRDDDPMNRLSAVVARADAVVVAGGGNLSASWPHLLYERVTLLELAARHDVPAIVCGQTIGPVLTERQRLRLGNALARVLFVGARDVQTLNLLISLGAQQHAALQIDDAIVLPDGEVDESLPDDYVALCVHQYHHDRSKVVVEVTSLLADLHNRTGLPTVLFPNTAASSSAAHRNIHDDATLATQIVEAIGNPQIATASALTSATSNAAGIRHSVALVSTRFHPLVFALSSGVPAMAITSDQYTGFKLGGALERAGLWAWQVPTDALATSAVAELFGEMWTRRSEIRSHLQTVTPTWFESHRRRWDALWSALNGDTIGLDRVIDESATQPPTLSPMMASIAWINSLATTARERAAFDAYRFDLAEESAFSLRHLVGMREAEIDGWKRLAGDLERRLAEAEAIARMP